MIAGCGVLYLISLITRIRRAPYLPMEAILEPDLAVVLVMKLEKLKIFN